MTTLRGERGPLCLHLMVGVSECVYCFWMRNSLINALSFITSLINTYLEHLRMWFINQNVALIHMCVCLGMYVCMYLGMYVKMYVSSM